MGGHVDARARRGRRHRATGVSPAATHGGRRGGGDAGQGRRRVRARADEFGQTGIVGILRSMQRSEMEQHAKLGRRRAVRKRVARRRLRRRSSDRVVDEPEQRRVHGIAQRHRARDARARAALHRFER